MGVGTSDGKYYEDEFDYVADSGEKTAPDPLPDVPSPPTQPSPWPIGPLGPFTMTDETPDSMIPWAQYAMENKGSRVPDIIQGRVPRGESSGGSSERNIDFIRGRPNEAELIQQRIRQIDYDHRLSYPNKDTRPRLEGPLAGEKNQLRERLKELNKPETAVAPVRSPVKEPERITDAAMKDRAGKLYTGPNHYNIMQRPDVTSLSDKDFDEMKDGFVTNTGRFVTREEAAIIGRNADQITEDLHPMLQYKGVETLTSENLKQKAGPQTVEGNFDWKQAPDFSAIARSIKKSGKVKTLDDAPMSQNVEDRRRDKFNPREIGLSVLKNIDHKDLNMMLTQDQQMGLAEEIGNYFRKIKAK